MKKINAILLSSFFLKPWIAFADFVVTDPVGGLFDNTTKVSQGVKTVSWLINMSSGLFSIVCFISAGNYARQGNIGRASGAAIGGVIAALGAYFVTAVR